MPNRDSEISASALDATEDAVGVYDHLDRLVAFNHRYDHLRSAIGGDVVVGVPWNDLVTESVRAGAIGEAVGREAEWLASRRRLRGAYSVVRDVPGGGSYQVTERRMPNGGIAVVWCDVTTLVRRSRLVSRRLAQLSAAMSDGRRDASVSGEISYDPDELIADSLWWRRLAAQSDGAYRRMCLGRAAKCEQLVRRSIQIQPIAV